MTDASLLPVGPRFELRQRLEAMRDSLIAGMAASRVLESAHVGLLGNVGAALAALTAVDLEFGATQIEPVVQTVIIRGGLPE